MKQLLVLGAVLVMTPTAENGFGSEPRVWTPSAVSTDGYESSPTFTPDGREMYYVSADRSFRSYRIMVSRCETGGWSKGLLADFAAPAPTIEADPFVTRDGRRLYFVSARHDPKNEDFDIYVVDRRPDGSWASPLRLPPPVNSKASELFPRLDGQGRLYFGSARPGGYGQSDIYSATEISPGEWRVENVGPPVSTAANEYEAEVSRDGRRLVVVADRGSRSHLYRFERTNNEWTEIGRVPAREDVFQVGPLLSPKGQRLLFGQAHGDKSGEIFAIDLMPQTAEAWPPKCRA